MADEFKQVALNCLQRQFGYTNISDLMIKKAAIWDANYGTIAKTFNEEILNFNTCIPEALDYFWGKIYRITRTFTNNLGELLVLDDDTFREIIKIRAFGSRWNGSIAEMNEFLAGLFGNRGNAYMMDLQNMTVEIFVFEFPLSEEELYLFKNKDILPRPAGVGIDILEAGKGTWFGFRTYNQVIYPRSTTGFGTYTGMEAGQFATYNDNI